MVPIIAGRFDSFGQVRNVKQLLRTQGIADEAISIFTLIHLVNMIFLRLRVISLRTPERITQIPMHLRVPPVVPLQV